jgi:hypothetical protein
MHFDPGTQCTINGWAAGTVVGEWGCWTAAEPESGKPETINGANIYDVEFETGGRRSVNASRLRPIDLTRGLSQSPLLNRLFGSDASEIRW